MKTKWCVRCTQPGHHSHQCPQPNPIFQTPPKEAKMTCTRHEIDDNCFTINREGRPTDFYCIRETLENGARGHWLLMRKTMAGELIADRDQYSNDLIERVDIALAGRNPCWLYDSKFKLKCTEAEYLDKAPVVLMDLGFQFGGDWASEYFSWGNNTTTTQAVGLAVFIRKGTS